MFKQILKGATLLMAIVAFSLAMAAVSANAQSRTKVRAQIPFDFIVGDETLPAGDYSVSSMSSVAEVLLISSRQEKTSAMRLASEITKRSNTRARLVFHRYGNDYFLSEVWPADSTGKVLEKSKREKAIERELTTIAAKTEFAAGTYELVEIAAVRD